MNLHELGFEKQAAINYPFSRLYQGIKSLKSFGLRRAIQARATMGRAAVAKKGLTGTERGILQTLQGKTPVTKGGRLKTYPISRFLTSPVAMGTTAATLTLPAAVAAGPFAPMVLASSAGLTAGRVGLGRATAARGYIGRAASPKVVKGILPSDKRVIEAIRQGQDPGVLKRLYFKVQDVKRAVF